MSAVNSNIERNSKHILLWLTIITSLQFVMPVWSFMQQKYHHDKLNNNDIANNLHLLDLLKRSGETNWEEVDPNCGIYRHQSLHVVMDRVCELCHEMFSHEENSLRAECRALLFCCCCSKNCFRNRKFRTCLQIFSPTTNGTDN